MHLAKNLGRTAQNLPRRLLGNALQEAADVAIEVCNAMCRPTADLMMQTSFEALKRTPEEGEATPTLLRPLEPDEELNWFFSDDQRSPSREQDAEDAACVPKGREMTPWEHRSELLRRLSVGLQHRCPEEWASYEGTFLSHAHAQKSERQQYSSDLALPARLAWDAMSAVSDNAEVLPGSWCPDVSRIVVTRVIGPRPAASGTVKGGILIPIQRSFFSALHAAFDTMPISQHCSDSKDRGLGKFSGRHFRLVGMVLLRGDCCPGVHGEGTSYSSESAEQWAQRLSSDASFSARARAVRHRDAWAECTLSRLKAASVCLLVCSGSVDTGLVDLCSSNGVAILPHCPSNVLGALSAAVSIEILGCFDDLIYVSSTVASVASFVCEAGWENSDSGRFIYAADKTVGTEIPGAHLVVSPAPYPGADIPIDGCPCVGVVLCGPTPSLVAELEYAFWRSVHRVVSALHDDGNVGEGFDLPTATQLAAGYYLPGGGAVEGACAEVLRREARRAEELLATAADDSAATGGGGVEEPWGNGSPLDSFVCKLVAFQAVAESFDAMLLQSLQYNHGMTVKDSTGRVQEHASFLRSVFHGGDSFLEDDLLALSQTVALYSPDAAPLRMNAPESSEPLSGVYDNLGTKREAISRAVALVDRVMCCDLPSPTNAMFGQGRGR